MKTVRIHKAIGRRPSVLYRWLRRHNFLLHAIIAACILVVLPLGIASGVHLSHFIETNQAMAATHEDLPQKSALVLSRALEKTSENIEKLHENDFLALFHEPDLRRQDGATKIWQYRADTCVLDVYFENATDSGNAGHVIHYEIRPRQTAAFGKQTSDIQESKKVEDVSGCLKKIAHRKT